jgi:folate-dependent phosphoribosylglycinamide formyltransferase PurN
MKPRIALLTRSSIQGKGLAQALLAGGLDLALIVTEERPGPRGFVPELKQVVAGLLGPRLTGRLMDWRNPPSPMEQQERLWAQRARDAMRDHFRLRSFPESMPAGVPHLRTPRINSSEVVDRLRSCEAQLIVVFATSKLERAVFQAAPLGAINGHTALLPDYRGSYVEFWQLYNEDYAKAGFTIHRIDRTLDTGAILYQETVPAGPADNPLELHARSAIALIDCFPQVVLRWLRGEVQEVEQASATTPTYRLRDVTPAKRLELYQRILARNPTQAGVGGEDPRSALL